MSTNRTNAFPNKNNIASSVIPPPLLDFDDSSNLSAAFPANANNSEGQPQQQQIIVVVNEEGETESIGSSVEIRDAAINESWDWTSLQQQRRLQAGRVGGSSNGARQHVHQKGVRLNIDGAGGGAGGAVPRLELALRGGQLGRHQEQPEDSSSWLNGIWRWWNERAINGRLLDYDEQERVDFIAQRQGRIASIFADECLKMELSQLMMCGRTHELLQREDPRAQALSRKHGQQMAEWVALYAEQMEQQHGTRRKQQKKSNEGRIYGLLTGKAHQAVMKARNGALERAVQADVEDKLTGNALNDPLMSWFRQRQDVSGRMLARIQQLAGSISQQVAWSFLIEPGRPKTDLSRFYAEFEMLESFFDKVELSPEECSQKAFDANCLFKVRNRKLVCLDWSRVRLTAPAELTQEGIGRQQLAANHTRRPQALTATLDIFADDFDCPRMATRTEFGHGDFINASRVLGGPLLNEFILTQAPLPHTMADFWRMVWQERSEWIFQLCDSSTDPSENSGVPSNGTVLDQLSRIHCPHFWPRFQGDVLRFGHLHVRNVGIDKATDPLFTVTNLVLWLEGEEEQDREDEPGPSTRPTRGKSSQIGAQLRVQHWQWDWRSYTDFHWPFRLLLRSRHSKRPTILMCADGCSRSGTLALIEIFLMQLLRGAVSFEHPMLTAAVFLRLQRRHAVANHIQWLFAYRAVLHWLQPFVISSYHRLVLGFSFPNHGFCAKYAEIAHSYAHRKNLLL